MVIAPATALIEGVSGEFAAFGQNVVPPGPDCFDAKAPACQLDHGQLLFQVIAVCGNQKCEIQVPQIVEHGAAAGEAAGQVAPLLFQ